MFRDVIGGPWAMGDMFRDHGMRGICLGIMLLVGCGGYVILTHVLCVFYAVLNATYTFFRPSCEMHMQNTKD